MFFHDTLNLLRKHLIAFVISEGNAAEMGREMEKSTRVKKGH